MKVTDESRLIKPDLTPDMYGRVPKICESGLAMTKASMSRFVMFCLKNGVDIKQIHPSNRNYHGCHVSAVVRIHPDLVRLFEAETGGKLRDPATLNLN
jgi:hypothetical protein